MGGCLSIILFHAAPMAPRAKMNVLQLKNVSHATTSKQIKSMGTFLKRKGTKIKINFELKKEKKFKIIRFEWLRRKIY